MIYLNDCLVFFSVEGHEGTVMSGYLIDFPFVYYYTKNYTKHII